MLAVTHSEWLLGDHYTLNAKLASYQCYQPFISPKLIFLALFLTFFLFKIGAK
jgi:hypothetical protein